MIAGRLDATLADSVALEQGFLKTPAGKGYAFKGPVYDDPAFFGTSAGIGMRKGEGALREAVNGALGRIRADGTYKTLNNRYFSFGIYGAEPAKSEAEKKPELRALDARVGAVVVDALVVLHVHGVAAHAGVGVQEQGHVAHQRLRRTFGFS